MKRLSNIVRAFFVSFEFLCIVIGILLTIWRPSAIQGIAEQIASNGDMIKYLALAPVGVFGWVFSHSRKMLFPEADKKSILQGWPDYPAFRDVVFVGVAFSVIFVVTGLATWAMDWSSSPAVPFTWTAVSLIGAAIAAFSMYHAEIVLTENLKT
jgi:hypothetical protein